MNVTMSKLEALFHHSHWTHQLRRDWHLQTRYKEGTKELKNANKCFALRLDLIQHLWALKTTNVYWKKWSVLTPKLLLCDNGHGPPHLRRQLMRRTQSLLKSNVTSNAKASFIWSWPWTSSTKNWEVDWHFQPTTYIQRRHRRAWKCKI